MKAKNLLKKAFLLMALMGGATSAWGATWTVDYSSKSKGWSVTDNQETMNVPDYGTVTIAYNNDAIVGNANYIKFSSNSHNVTITLPQGKTFKAGDKLEITGKGGKSSSPGCVYAVLGEDIIKAADIATSSTDNFDSGELTIPIGFTESNTLIIRRATSSETQTDGTTACGGTFYIQKIIYTKLAGPTINTQPVSASYQKDAAATALSVEATASAGELSYQWYSCDDAEQTNAAIIDGETNASYAPETSETGSFYFFCRVTDTNGTTDSNVATITVSNAYAPIVTPTASSVEVLQYEGTTLGVTIDAIPAATVQWYSCDDAEKSNPASISGATSATYSPSTSAIGTFCFYAVATNAAGSTASDVITLTVNPDITGETFYSWIQGTQTGGTAVASDGQSVGYANSTYTTIRLNGNPDFSDKTVTITLTNALKAGDKIKVTGYRNKNAANSQSGFKAKFENGAATVGSSTGLEFVNIDTSDASAEDENRGTEPNTCVFTVPASAAGSKTITMTRSHGSTNLFVTKIEVYRPTINFGAVLNAEGLLTAEEISSKSAFSFGITNANERVDVEAGNSVATISGTYHSDHGCTGLTVTAAVTKPVKITIGQCTYSKTQVTIKNSGSENVAQLNPNVPACWKNDHSKVDVFYYNGPATTLTISGMSYCPYVAIEEVEAGDAVVSITPANDKSTYVSTMTLDFSNVEGGLKAYVATAAAGGVVTLDEVDAVPAGTPLMLVGTADTKYTVPVVASASAPETNMFRAGDGTTEFDAESTTSYDYILFTDGKFYRIATDTTVPVGKAYLHCDSDPTTPLARELRISFGDNITGIEQIDNGQLTIDNSQDGKFIENGKLVIVKNGVKYNAAGAKLY